MGDDRKKQLEQRLVLGLAVIFGLTLFRTFLGGPGAKVSTPPTLPVATPQGSSATPPGNLEERHGAEPRPPAPAHQVASKANTDEKSPCDPLVSLLPKPVTKPVIATKPSQAVSPVVKPPSLAISGLIWGGMRPQAIVNGKVYGVGDEVQGARIIEITREGVTVEVGGVSFTVNPAATRRRMASTPPSRGAESQRR